jgi:hypothetical protein
MSDASDIVDAILADVTTAVTGVTTSTAVVQPDDRPDEDFPLAIILQTEYDVEPLDWGQENRIWTVDVALFQIGGTRETMQTKLEAVRDQIGADTTLASSCDRAVCVTAIPESHPDAARIAGIFVVRAEKVA